jgi:hypothetical protein
VTSQPRFLSDVDGVVAGLMQGFSLWMKEVLDEDLPVEQIVFHSNMGQSPGLRELNGRLRNRANGRFAPNDRHTSVGRAFVEFMNVPTCYESWVPVLPGAVEAFARISRRCEPTFVTAIMKDAPDSYASKVRWLKRHFPGVPVAAIPSEQKHFFQGTFAVDDRWDICQRWNRNGVSAYCFRQPWNEAPQGAYTYTWEGIANTLCGGFEGEF